MSLYDYVASKHLGTLDAPFYALIMAAMRQADSTNVRKLRAAFPEIWDEFNARYNAPGGLIGDEVAHGS